jgi:hypothetical protein
MTELIKKLKSTKGMPYVLIALAAGIALLLMPQSSGDSKNKGEQTGDSREYIEYMETKAEKLISTMEGVKSCKVMISASGGYRYSYASNQRVTQNGDSRDTQKEYVTIDGGASPLLTEQRMPEIIGVAVVCPGITADTEYRIMQLLSALFDVNSNRISITK